MDWPASTGVGAGPPPTPCLPPREGRRRSARGWPARRSSANPRWGRAPGTRGGGGTLGGGQLVREEAVAALAAR